MKGVILAAGEGARIKGVTYGAFPKELLPIGNVPTIRFSIESLKLVGINDILVVITAQGKNNIIQGLQSGRKFGVNLCYVVQEKNEGESSGIGKAILSVRNWIGDEDFLVACGDTILCDFSSENPFNCLTPALKIHTLNDPLATLVLQPTNFEPMRFGVAKFRKLQHEGNILYGEVESLVEKPSVEVAKAYMCNGYNYVVAGYYVLKPRIFSYIEKTKPGAKNEVQISDSIVLAIGDEEKVFGVVHGTAHGGKVFPCEYWDVGIPEAYKEANRRLIEINVDKKLARVHER